MYNGKVKKDFSRNSTYRKTNFINKSNPISDCRQKNVSVSITKNNLERFCSKYVFNTNRFPRKSTLEHHEAKQVCNSNIMIDDFLYLRKESSLEAYAERFKVFVNVVRSLLESPK